MFLNSFNDSFYDLDNFFSHKTMRNNYYFKDVGGEFIFEYEVPGLSKEDIIIDIQGDEPLVEPSTIDKVINETIKCRDKGGDIFLPHLNKCGSENKNIVKVVESNGKVIYLSRLDIPFGFSDTTSLKKVKKIKKS